jgi:AcrR family transcriptional regulator
VEAAFELVAAAGLEGLRLRDVASAVGIDHSTLHYHIATKQDLIEAIADYTVGQFYSTMPSNADPGSRLHGHLAGLRELMLTRPALFTVTAELDLRARRDPAVQAVMDRHDAGWRAALVEALRAGGHRSRLEATAGLVIAAVKGVRLDPLAAGAAFDELEAMLSSHRPHRPRSDRCPDRFE